MGETLKGALLMLQSACQDQGTGRRWHLGMSGSRAALETCGAAHSQAAAITLHACTGLKLRGEPIGQVQIREVADN